ncbi:MAG: carboxypeptidase-like regulatory domain-containing protein [Vicinamibacterales bacterium]
MAPSVLLLLLLGTPGADRHETPEVAATRGQVLDASGRAVVGATVTLEERDGAHVRVVVTDAAGCFEVVALAPGHFDVRAQHPAHRMTTVRWTHLTAEEQVSLTMRSR